MYRLGDRFGPVLDSLESWTSKAELHWYEATGIGRYELKIKRYLD